MREAAEDGALCAKPQQMQGFKTCADVAKAEAEGEVVIYAFNVPPDGMPGTPETWGVVANTPHPNAGRLFIDWLLSQVGQKAIAEGLYIHSMRADVPPPPGGLPITQIKLLIPEDWQGFLTSRPAFQREWDKITGLR